MKTSSLFSGRPVRNSRMTIMIAASILVHTGILAVGARWQQAEAPDITDQGGLLVLDEPTKIEFEHEPSDQILYVHVGAPTPQIESTPVAVEPPVRTEVPSDDIPVMQPPPVPVKHTPVGTVRATQHPPGVPSSSTTGTRGIGSPDGSGASSIARWKTPRPPYPQSLMLARVQGATTVRVTTDAAGNVVDIVIIKSAGNPALDASTQNYVRNNWKGPATSSRTVEFVYRIP